MVANPRPDAVVADLFAIAPDDDRVGSYSAAAKSMSAMLAAR